LKKVKIIIGDKEKIFEGDKAIEAIGLVVEHPLMLLKKYKRICIEVIE